MNTPKNIRCARCGLLFERTANSQKYCPECAAVVRKHQLEWHNTRKKNERRHAIVSERELDSPEEIRACMTCVLPDCHPKNVNCQLHTLHYANSDWRHL